MGWPAVFISSFGSFLNNGRVGVLSTSIHFLLFTLCILIQPARCWYCRIPGTSVETVDSCPSSQAEWNQRSVAKNCTSYYSQKNCSSPETYIYHCVITPFINGTVEVCAQKAFINFGYCAEYDIKGKLIQENYDAKCLECPQRYLSTDAYKYQECYNLTQKKEETMTSETPSKSDIISTSNILIATSTAFPFRKKSNKCDSVCAMIIGLLLPVLSLSCIVIGFAFKKKMSPLKPKVFEEEERKLSEVNVQQDEVHTRNDSNPKAETELLLPLIEQIPTDSSSPNEGQILTSGQRYTYSLERAFPYGTVHLDEEDEVPDISVRDKQRFLADDQEDQRMKEEALMTLNDGMLNLAFEAEKDDNILPSLLENYEYTAVMEEVECCKDTDFTSEKAPLLESYAERIQYILKRSGKILTSGQRYTHPLERTFHYGTEHLDEKEEVPDISVRDKQRFFPDDQDYESMKEEALMTLNDGMLNLAYEAEKDDNILPSLLQDYEYRAVMEEVEYCKDTDFTSEKAPLLKSYAERIQYIVKRSARQSKEV